jgi:streptogramin lyase
METNSTDRAIKRKRGDLIRLAAFSAFCLVETLEPRQLLSAVNVFQIPGADPSSWDGSQSHIVADANGNYWFTDATDNAIGEVTPAGAVTMFPLPALPANSDATSQSPVDIVLGPDNNIWFTENGADAIGRITANGTITEFHTPTADSNPLGLAVGPDGNLWFAESNGSAIGKITTDGKITEYPVSTLDVSELDGFVGGPDGKVWFIAYDNNGNGTLDSITSDGHITSFPLADDPTALAAGPDGDLWVGTDSGNIDRVGTNGDVTTFAIPDDADVNDLVAGSDGDLYFSLDGNNQLGRITTSGVISEFTFPANAAQNANGPIEMAGLTQDSDGTIWFVDQTNPQVGSVNLSNALLATSNDVTVTAGTPSTATFASFTDFAGGTDPSAYTATISIDGAAAVNATITANANGGFDVNYNTDWTLGGSTFNVTITDNSNATRIATATGSLTINAPPATGVGIAVTATSGQNFSGTVATFTGLAMNSLSSYSASIEWGDGQTTVGTITVNSTGGVNITGSDTYAAAGTYTVTTTLLPYASSGGIFSLPPGVGVVSPGVTVGSATGVANGGSAGVPIATPPIVVSPPISTGPIPVDPVLPISPILPITSDGSATATTTAKVAAGVMDGTGFSVQATSTAPFTGNVASFVLADPTADTSHFHATITWSDPGVRDWTALSTPASAGVITSDGAGNLTISTTASFANSGLFHFTVTITDDRLAAGANSVGVAYGQLIVDSPNIWFPVYQSGGPTAVGLLGGGVLYASPTSGSSSSATINPVLSEHVTAVAASIETLANHMFKGPVGVLKGVIPGAKHLADLHGTIHWGDGTTSAATFAKGKGGAVSVLGTHQYTQPGADAISVDMTQTLYAKGKPTTNYPLILPDIATTATVASPHTKNHAIPVLPGNAITIAAGATFNGTLATVTLPATPAGDSLAVLIHWGDGKTSAGVITASAGNTYTITASHVYRKHGKYKVSAVVSQTASGVAGHKAKLQTVAKVELMATVTA